MLKLLYCWVKWLLSNRCPYCKLELEPCWSGSYLCPRCGYDNMTGRTNSGFECNAAMAAAVSSNANTLSGINHAPSARWVWTLNREVSATAVPLASTCKWTLVDEPEGASLSLYRSECGIMLTRRQEWWKYCQLCGKEIQ